MDASHNINKVSRGETICSSAMAVRRGIWSMVLQPHSECFWSGAGDGFVVSTVSY